ncbi:MAG: Na/Pi symporter [Bacteroidales bacterium]|nr:Na/Pi symporter [Bacteroidales bacterium]
MTRFLYIPDSYRLMILVILIKTGITYGQDTALSCHIIRDSIQDKSYMIPYGLTGKKINTPFNVKIIDDKGNPVAGYPVAFTILSEPVASSGAFVENDTVYTNTKGKAGTFLHLGSTPGDYLVAARICYLSDSDTIVYKATARKKSWILLLIAGFLGGLAFFLFGIKMLSDGLQKSAGEQLYNVIERLTNNRFKSFLVGILITVMVQSSSATTVMLVSFVNSRLMQFTQTVGIILGAAVGGTITAQIIAFRIADYALLIIGLGFLPYMLLKNPKYRDISFAIMGFGMIFFGMHVMSQAMEPMQSMKEFIALLLILENPFLGILAGVLLTAIIQSSCAFVGILIILASQHLLTLTAAIPLIIGASLGTSITAIIASLGLSRESKQVALTHTLFKTTGAIIMVWFIPQLVDLVEIISPHTAAGSASHSFSPATMARQIANAYTVYNFVIALLFLPFTRQFANLVTRLLPVREEKVIMLKTWYLDANLLRTPTMALAVARQEILRMIQSTHRMTEDIIIPFIEKKSDKITSIKEREIEINFLRDKINAYLIQISRQDIESRLIEEVFAMMYTVNEFEQIGDIVSSGLCEKALWWINAGFSFSPKGKEEIQNFHFKTLKLLYYAYGVFRETNRDKAKKMKSKYQDFRNMYIDFEKQHYQRLKEEVEESLDSSKTHLEVITSFKNIGSHATNIARIMLKK